MVVTVIAARKVPAAAAAAVDSVSVPYGLDHRGVGCRRTAGTHQIDAEAKARNADSERVHVSPRTKSEGALRNAYRTRDGRVERRGARRARHGAAEVDDVWTGNGHLC
jgi:hypothetical protein